MCRNISYVQDILQRQILVENPTAYMQFSNSTMSESEFLCQVATRCGCKLILDINNIYVNAVNHGVDGGMFASGLGPWVGVPNLGGRAKGKGVRLEPITFRADNNLSIPWGVSGSQHTRCFTDAVV